MEAVNISSSLSSTLEEVQKSNVAGVLKFNDVFQSERDDVIFYDGVNFWLGMNTASDLMFKFIILKQMI